MTTRRQFIGRGSAGLMTLALAGCGIEGTATQTLASLKVAAARVRHPKGSIGNWTFSNWPLYIDKKIIAAFDRTEGGRCKYVEEINDNAEFFGKVRQQLARGVPIGRDIVTLTDYMVSRWVRSGYVTPIDDHNIPNKRNLIEGYYGVPYDPERQFTMPWQSGVYGLGYDIRQTGGELKSLKSLFDPKYKGRVTMFSEQYDSAGMVLIMQGKNPTKATFDDQLGAIELMKEAADRGQFRRFTGNDYTTDLAKGNIAIALASSGDLVQLQADNPNLRFVYPEEGSLLWTDNMMMPAHVQHPYAAERMMNYVYDPEVAAKITAYVNYISPVKGVREVLERTNPEIAENELIFPSDETRKRLYDYPTFAAVQERQLAEAMAAVTGQ